MLTDSGWDGGGGYTPNEVGQFTLDQVFFRLCDAKILRSGQRERVQDYSSTDAMDIAEADGFIKGRDRHGNPMQAVIKGESLAHRLNRELEETAVDQKETPRKRRRRLKRERASKLND